MALFELSGRVFTGACERVVRPCRDGCGCWGEASAGLGPWAWAYGNPWGAGTGWGWWGECGGNSCGCGSLSRVPLAGYPVREITEVLIGGVVLDPLDVNGNPNYRLDGWRWLTRMDDPGPPVVKRYFPHCQNLALNDTEEGTFSISYVSGVDPPQLGVDAAAELACELWKNCSGGQCALPPNATKVTRQGVQIEKNILLAFLTDPTKPTGLLSLDLFLSVYGIKGRGRRGALWSPDSPAFGLRIT